MAGHLLQAVAEDRLDVASGGAVIEHGGRLDRFELQIDLDASAPGWRGCACRSSSKAKRCLSLRRDDLVEFVAADGKPVRGAGGEQVVDRDPAAGFQRQARGAPARGAGAC